MTVCNSFLNSHQQINNTSSNNKVPLDLHVNDRFKHLNPKHNEVGFFNDGLFPPIHVVVEFAIYSSI